MSRTIYSYRRVFKVDRRIYKLDPQGRLRLPIPGGLPLRSAVYFGATLGALLLVSTGALLAQLVMAGFSALVGRRLAGAPGAIGGLIGGYLAALVLGALLGVLPWPAFVVIPAVVASVGQQVEPDGRAPHKFLVSWAAHQIRRRRSSLGRPVPLAGDTLAYQLELSVAPDERSPVLRRSRIEGPGIVTFRDLMLVTASRSRRVKTLHARVRPAGRRPGRRQSVVNTIELAADETLEVSA